MLGDSVDDIIDLEKSLDDSELLFSSKIVKEKKVDEVAIQITESLFEENVPESILTAVPLSPPFRKVSDVKFYRPPTPAKPLIKRVKIEDEIDEESTEEIDENDAERSCVAEIARLARLNPSLSFIPRLRRNVLK